MRRSLCLAVFVAAVACDSESPGSLGFPDVDGGAGGRPGAGGTAAGSGGSARGGARPQSGGASGAPSERDGGWGHVDSGDAAVAPDPTRDGSPPGSGGSVIDAAPPPEDTGTPCTRRTFYADGDGDGFGDASRVIVACTPPADGAWTELSGDCNDHDADARPLQAGFFGVPHEQPGSEPSFDYDCSGTEEPDPSQPLAPASCGLLSLALCGGEGHVSTPRTGPGLDPHCGSRMKTTCRAALGILVCEAVTAPTEEAFRCK